MSPAPQPLFRIKPIGNRMRNMLMSVGLCVALVGAYYVVIGNETVPPDTAIVFTQAACGGGCMSHRVDIDATGEARITQPGAPVALRHISKTGLRQILHAFRHEAFLDLDVTKFTVTPGDDVCSLSLTLDHRKTMIRYGCQHPPAAAAKPLEVVEHILKAARNG